MQGLLSHGKEEVDQILSKSVFLKLCTFTWRDGIEAEKPLGTLSIPD